MLPYLRSGTPVAVIANFAEAHENFLGRSQDPSRRASLLDGESYHGDRTLLWVGDPKLVITSYPIPHAEDLCRRLGYAATRYATPKTASYCLCHDILSDNGLIGELVNHAGPARAIQLVPYATTPEFLQLVQSLHHHHGLSVSLPESPLPQAMWLRDLIDSKSGFYLLAGRWLANSDQLLPTAYPCTNVSEAAHVAGWFSSRGLPCIVKPDRGESGIGSQIILPQSYTSDDMIRQQLQEGAYWGQDLLLVEELIPSSTQVSPSIELFVPVLGEGDPAITYLSKQLFRGFGAFCGVLVTRTLADQPWYPVYAESALIIAKHLQELGYAGHFDIDAIVDDRQQVFLLEINARRTGGTHVHEFASYFFGPNYLDDITVESWESVDSGTIATFEQLQDALTGLLYPIHDRQRGIIVTITSSLARHKFGTIIIGSSEADTASLQTEMEERLATYQKAQERIE